MLRSMLLALFLAAPAVGIAAPTAGPPSGSDLPDIEAFMQIGYAGSPQISPDGKVVYFLSNSSGVAQIYRLDRTDGWPYQLTVFSEGVNFYTLSPTGTSIICGVGMGGNENSQLWYLDAATGAARALTASPEVRHGSPSWTSDGKTIFFNSNEANGKDFYIYRMDVASGKKSLLVQMEGWNGAGDVSDDDKNLIVVHASSNVNTDLYLVDTARGRRTHLTPHQGDVLVQGAQFDTDGKRIYMLSNDNPDGISRRAVLDIATRKVAFLDPENPWEVESLGISPDRRILGWGVNEDGYLRLRLLDLARNQEIPAPPMDGQIGGFAFSRRNTLAFNFSSATSTSDVWLWNWNAPELTKISRSTYAGIDPSQFVAPQLVRYPSFDGTEIPAFLYLPPDYRAGTPVPFIIHAHGGPESQFRPAFIRHFQYLLLHGYGILAPNVRGSSGYGKAFMALDNYKNRLDSVKDLKAGVDYLIEEGYSAPGMLAVKGGSYGGYMTLAAITEYPDLFSAAIDEVGIANYVTFLENTAAYRRALREAEYGPLTDKAFLESISPIHKADRIRTPLLVIHGENDPRVPVGEARQIAAAITAGGGEVDTLIFPDEGHGVAKRPNVLVLYRRMVEFLDHYLKAPAAGGRGSD